MGMVKSIKSIIYQKNGIDIKQILFKKDESFKSTIPEKLMKPYESISKKWAEKKKIIRSKIKITSA
jgi:hypothetical protein